MRLATAMLLIAASGVASVGLSGSTKPPAKATAHQETLRAP
jgi:hypothetical protein